jgi:phosphatidate cytidylyltransferase
MVRVASGVLLAAIFFALVWFTNATVLLVVALAVATLALHEYVQLFRALGANLPALPTLLVTWGVTIVVPFPHLAVEAVFSIGLILIAMWVMSAVGAEAGKGHAEAARGAAAAALAAVYIGLGLGSLVGIHVYGGRGAVVLLMATIVVSDTAQYYAGRTFGKHPLSLRLSPKKTVEGAVGGFLLAPLFLAFAGYYLVPAATNQLALGLLGVALVMAGIAGDLFESTLKRAAGVKDSSALIPGHGGVLDRIDALLFAAPLFYLYLRSIFS